MRRQERYQEKNEALGRCQNCPQPVGKRLNGKPATLCNNHLAKSRQPLERIDEAIKILSSKPTLKEFAHQFWPGKPHLYKARIYVRRLQIQFPNHPNLLTMCDRY